MGEHDSRTLEVIGRQAAAGGVKGAAIDGDVVRVLFSGESAEVRGKAVPVVGRGWVMDGCRSRG